MSATAGTGTHEPRVWRRGDPEPTDTTTVRTCLVIWTRKDDGLWHSSNNPDIAYTWHQLSKCFRKFTEVLAMPAEWPPRFENVFGPGVPARRSSTRSPDQATTTAPAPTL